MKTGFSLVLSLIAAVPFVAGHGLVQDIKLDGKLIKGNRINGGAIDSSIRRVFSQDPIKGANNAAINCGSGAIPAKLILDANPGSKIEFNWRAADGSPWPHNIGPMMTYLASCGSTTCDKFDPAKAKWFKIDQVGRKPNSDQWVQEDTKNGKFTPPVTIPKTLAAGNYMVRHEIIALHLANTKGGAEFYAGCVQMKVGGSETGAPSADELVLLPGAYKDSDPGIFVPDVFNSGSKYSFPGPAVSKLAAKASEGGDNKGESGSCKLKTDKNKAQAKMEYQPRHVSRVMRDVKFH